MDEKTLGALLSFAQSALWVGLIVWVIVRFGRRLESIMDLLGVRIGRGDKVATPWLSLESAPASLRSDGPAVATAEGEHGAGKNADIVKLLQEKKYPEAICESVYLVHAARTLRERTPQQRGHYRVRVWVEAYDGADLRDIQRVTYRLYNDEFPEPVVATVSLMNNFELWLNVYGEFTVVAYAERKGGHPIWMARYLDLPGRPPE